MARMRCPRCGRAYDLPTEIALRLTKSYAECLCGEWLAGSKAALLARLLDPADMNPVPVTQYLVDSLTFEPLRVPEAEDDDALAEHPRNVRITARTISGMMNRIFSVENEPLWIGQKGSHVELDDADISIRHCSIENRREGLVLHDADSHTGTFLDGEPITEAVLEEGVHILRVGDALICVEPTPEPGAPVEPMGLSDDDSVETSPQAARLLRERKERAEAEAAAAAAAATKQFMLVCLEGTLAGQRFEIPATGLVVGREGDVRVPDDFLSRRHFEIAFDPDRTLRVRDMGSRNGTFLNTFPARNAKAHAGDEIRAGMNLFRLEEQG